MTAALPFVQSMHAAALQRRLPGSGLAWLDAARADALQAFADRGLPDQRNELWKYTSLRALAQRAFAANDAAAASRAGAAALLPV
ncbi:MAG: Fe-S cluster assembly protein SufD, partial [Xanthomonadaceae bacterium]|nr:Fe-S cluster assembly protein SufD [Xanthomonadaceae bacterium]